MAKVRGQVEKGGTGVPDGTEQMAPCLLWIQASVGTIGLRPAQELISFGWEDISVTSFSKALGRFQAPNAVGHPNSPSFSLWRGAPFGEGGMHF